MSVDIWILDGTDAEYEDVINIIRMALGAADEAEVAHPETISSLRRWCNDEWKRIFPPEPVVRLTPEQEVMAALRRSPHWPFWESLETGQEVRWTGTKNATYFVVDPNPVTRIPDNAHTAVGAYIELRRHTGKTFWSHIGKVRPLSE